LLVDGEDMICNDAEYNLSGKELRSLLVNAIGRLSDQQKRVYILIKEEGLKREKVAHMLHLHPETVKFHLAQAVKNIRAFCRIYISTFIGVMASIN
jgi:RNA polymerase sigma-70 factor (ECF subfamily)